MGKDRIEVQCNLDGTCNVTFQMLVVPVLLSIEWKFVYRMEVDKTKFKAHGIVTRH